MGTNPYEAPQADISGRSPTFEGQGAAGAVTSLPPELENRATALLGQKRSRAAGASLAVAGAACIGPSILLFGFLLAFIIGGVIATVISKAWVKGRTQHYIARVCAELGIPPGAFRPEKYLL